MDDTTDLLALYWRVLALSFITGMDAAVVK